MTKKLIFNILTAVFSVFCYNISLYSSSLGNDTLHYVYKGIPENRIFDRWLLLGPVTIGRDNQKQPDREIQAKQFEKDFIAPSKVNNSILKGAQTINNSLYQWRFFKAENGVVNLTNSIKNVSSAMAYAYMQIEMSEEIDFILKMGSDDAFKIWVNGVLAHKKLPNNKLELDKNLIHVKLRKGTNQILLKTQNKGNSWEIICRAIMPSEYSQELFLNVQNGYIEDVKQLIKCGADINSVSSWGLTPFQTAKFCSHHELAKFLSIQGADTTMENPSKEKMIDHYFNYLTKTEYPGAAVLISKDGKILHEKAYGFANLEYQVPFKEDMKFRIGSVTKQFTAVAILKLHQQGILNVYDTVSKYIPEFPTGKKITIHQLLTHTSGLYADLNKQGYFPVPSQFDTKEILEEIKHIKYYFNPGESWSYCNLGFGILRLIIEKVTGLSYIDFLSKSFFEPLGMKNTGIYKWDDLFGWQMNKNEVCGYYYLGGNIYRSLNLDRSTGAGSLYSTLNDLFIWNEALYNYNVLDSASLGASLRPVQTKDGSPDKYGYQHGYGMFMQEIKGVQRIYHGGALDGYECNLTRLSNNNMNIIVLLNRFPFPPGINSDIIAREIAKIYLSE